MVTAACRLVVPSGRIRALHERHRMGLLGPPQQAVGHWRAWSVGAYVPPALRAAHPGAEPAERPKGACATGCRMTPTNVERRPPTRSSAAPLWMRADGTLTPPSVAAAPSVPEREDGARLPQVIALATDLTDASEAATQHAIELAARLGARLIVINVLERRRSASPGRHARTVRERADREQALRPIVRRALDRGIRTESLVWAGHVGPGILAVAEAEGVDLIVVGTHGRQRAGRLLAGSVSSHLVRHAPMSVMVVRRAAG